jgi:hypothetical protein
MTGSFVEKNKKLKKKCLNNLSYVTLVICPIQYVTTHLL